MQTPEASPPAQLPETDRQVRQCLGLGQDTPTTWRFDNSEGPRLPLPLDLHDTEERPQAQEPQEPQEPEDEEAEESDLLATLTAPVDGNFDDSGLKIVMLTTVTNSWSGGDMMTKHLAVKSTQPPCFTNEFNDFFRNEAKKVFGTKRHDPVKKALVFVKNLEGATDKMAFVKTHKNAQDEHVCGYTITVDTLVSTGYNVDAILSEINAQVKPHGFVLTCDETTLQQLGFTIDLKKLPSGQVSLSSIQMPVVSLLLDLRALGMTQEYHGAFTTKNKCDVLALRKYLNKRLPSAIQCVCPQVMGLPDLE